MKKRFVIAGIAALDGAMAWSPSAQAQVNEDYACYQAKSLKTSGVDGHKYKPSPSGTIVNEVEVKGGDYSKCKFKLLCLPTRRNSGPVPPDLELEYCGWQCKGGKPVVPFIATDQFGGGLTETKKLKFLLVKCLIY